MAKQTTKRAPKKRLFLELLEDRTLMSSGPVVIENFQSGLGAYKTELRYQSAYRTESYPDVPGDAYLRLSDDYAWINRTDAGATVRQGDIFDTWVWLSGGSSPAERGRVYVGFGADAVDEPGFLSSGRTYSFVVAANTNELILQRNDGYRHTNLGAVPQTITPDRWYYVAVYWYTDGTLIGSLWEDASGSESSLINFVVAADTAYSSGGLAFRSIGNDKWIYDVTNYPGILGAGASPAGLGAPVLPDVVRDHAQRYNPLKNTTLAAHQQAAYDPTLVQGQSGAAVAGALPNPWQYVTVPGTGRNIQMDVFDDPRVIPTSGVPVGGQVGLVARNRSFNRNVGTPVPGTLQVQWGPIVQGLFGSNLPNESPLIQFFAYRRNGGVGSSVRICESDTKHFFLATGLDGQHLRPGERDTYSSISENSNQQLYAPQSLMNPVTGRTTKDFFGNRNNDGIVTNVPRSYPTSIDRLCRVNVSDINPALHPAGTTWYMAAMVYVNGDQDINDNSAWFQILPTVGATVSVVQTGSTFQNFRTLPGITTGAGPAGVEAPVVLESGPVDDEVAISLALPAQATTVVPVNEPSTSDEDVPAVPVDDLAYLVNGTGLIPTAGKGNQTAASDEVFAQDEDPFADPVLA